MVEQTGIVRTNCIDCLDRTNVTQVLVQFLSSIILQDTTKLLFKQSYFLLTCWVYMESLILLECFL